jgi:hypothetical protein
MSLYSYYVCILRSSSVIISFPPGPFPGELLKNILSLYALTKLVRILYLSLPSCSMLMSFPSPTIIGCGLPRVVLVFASPFFPPFLSISISLAWAYSSFFFFACFSSSLVLFSILSIFSLILYMLRHFFKGLV